ncbi:hypothetical protein HDU67_001811, partial [Dinochytrium kinnereticum]
MKLATIRSLISNIDTVEPLLLAPGRRYMGDPNPTNTAATIIQVNWRAFSLRRVFVHYMRCRSAALTIVRGWRFKMHRRSLAAAIRARFEMVHMKRYHRLVAYLRREWVHIEARKRVVILLAPKMYEVDDFDLVLGSFQDKNPMSPTSKRRLHIVVPECSKNFKPLANVARMLLASVRSLTRIRQLVKDRTSLLLCDAIGEPEVTLSSILDVPLLGSLPSSYRRINTRDKARILMKEAGLDVAPAIRATGKERDMCMYFAKCTLMHPDVPRWNLFEDRGFGRSDFARQDDKPDAWIESKYIGLVDPERIRAGRLSVTANDFQPNNQNLAMEDPLESFHYTPLPYIPEALASSKNKSKGWGFKKAAQRLTNLQRNLRQHLNTRDGADYNIFLTRWCRNASIVASAPLWVRVRDGKGPDGGIIQAVPVTDGTKMRRVEIGAFIDPKGKWSLVGSAETILSANFLETAVVVPQQSCNKETVIDVLKKISWTCIAKGILGFLTIQLVTWTEEATGWRRSWCTNFFPFLSSNILRCGAVSLSTGCEINPQTGYLTFKWDDVPLHLQRSHLARFVDKKKMREEFKKKMISEFGPDQRRVAVYALSLEHSELEDKDRVILP